MHLTLATVSALLSGVVLLIGGFVLGMERKERTIMTIAGVGLAVYAGWGIIRTEGTFYYSPWFFIIPLAAVAYFAVNRGTATDKKQEVLASAEQSELVGASLATASSAAARRTDPQGLTRPPQYSLSAAELAVLKKPPRSAKWWLGTVASVVGMALIVIYCLLPFYWMLISSFRLPTMGLSNDYLPSPWSVENYTGVFSTQNNFLRAILNSVVVSVTTTVLTLVFGIIGAYALARLRFAAKGLILGIIIGASMFPGVTLLVPLFKLFTGSYSWLPINWLNQYQAAIIPSLSFGLPLAVWNLTSFFRQLPVELEQAAMVDGCTPGEAFRKIILPLAAPGVFTTAILTFIAVWNEFMISLTFLQAKEMKTATVALSQFTGTLGYNVPYGSIMAAGVITTIPLLILVLFFQRRIVAGLTAGGVK